VAAQVFKPKELLHQAAGTMTLQSFLKTSKNFCSIFCSR